MPSFVELGLHTLPGGDKVHVLLYTGSLREARAPSFQLLWRF